jgi:calcineurin-like phosphoesterase family protein
VVPGNHDIEREVNKKHWSDLVKKLKPLDQNKVSMWFLGEKRIDAIPPEQRDAVLARSHAYRDWVANGIKRSALLPTAARHPNLGYRASFQPPGCRFEVHVIGLDSAFMCGGDRDKGSLLLTSDQIMLQATKSDQLSLPGFRVALVHHPLSWLADERVALNLLGPRVDLLLRGHVHSPEVSYWADPERMLLQFVAASVFDSEDLDSFPNGCQIIEAHLDDDGRPQKYDLRICSWSPKGRHWFDDGGIYKDATGGRLALFPR